MLSRADMVAIRQIVREEIRAALQSAPSVARQQPDAYVAAAGPDDTTLADATWAALRGEPGAAERMRRLEARRLVQEGNRIWLWRARKLLGLQRGAVVSEADMLATLKHYRAARTR